MPRLCTDTKGTTRKGDFYMNRQFIMLETAIKNTLTKCHSIMMQKLPLHSTQHFCTKLEYFQDKTQTKVQNQKMEFWTQNSILPQCAFIAKVWITLHGWVGFYWVVKPRHISTWTVDMNRAYFPSHLIPIDDPGLWFKSSPSMFAQKTFTTSRLQNKSWGFLHTSKLFDDSKL